MSDQFQANRELFLSWNHTLWLIQPAFVHAPSVTYKMSLLCSLFFLFLLINLFLIGGWLRYNIVSVSAILQRELAIGIHMSPPSWTSLPPPTPSHPSRLLQSPGFSSPSHTANPCWLSTLYMECICFHDAVSVSHPLLPLSAPCP